MDFNGLKDKLLSKLGQTADNTRDFADKAGDSVKDFAGKAADKVKAGGRIAKLTMEISSEKETMKKAYLEIGRLYYEKHKDDPEGFFAQLCEEVAVAEKNIADKEAEIAELKSKKDEPDVAVEFEEIVEQEESAAGEAVETVAEKAADFVEDAKDAVADAAEDAADVIEDAKDAVADAAEAVEDKVEDVVENITEE